MGKLIYDENNGYSYMSDNGIKYDILEGFSYKGKTTSDALFIMLSYEDGLFEEIDVEPYQLVDWFYSAGDCPSAEFISHYVNLYEKKHPEIVNWFKKKKGIIKQMPSLYKVKWTQTLVGEFEVEARSEEEAKELVLYSGDYDVNEIIDSTVEVIAIGD